LEYWDLRHFCPWSTGDIFYWCVEMDTSSTTLFYQFTTGIMRKFAEGASLPYFQYPITSFWLVSWVTDYWRGFVLILPVQLHFTGLRLVLCASFQNLGIWNQSSGATGHVSSATYFLKYAGR
jgi:hypothetical protein